MNTIATATNSLSTPRMLDFGPTNSLFIADETMNEVKRLNTAGVATFTGNGLFMPADGVGTLATISAFGLGTDTSGSVYVADYYFNAVRKVSSSGHSTTVAGGNWFSGSGTNTNFGSIQDVCVDSYGDIFVCESWKSAIRKISPNSVVSTLAGGGGNGFADGVGTNAMFNNPNQIVLRNDALLVADLGNRVIRSVLLSGEVSTIAGKNGTADFADGFGTNARFRSPNAIALDSWGNLYVADSYNNRIRKISPNMYVSTFAGTGTQGPTDGPTSSAKFTSPQTIAISSTGIMIIGDKSGSIRMISTSGIVSTISSCPSVWGYTDGVGSSACFNGFGDMAIDAFGNLLVADSYNFGVRKFSSAGQVTTLVGSGSLVVDGTGSNARIYRPFGVAVDTDGTVYVSQFFNDYYIRKISSVGFVTTFAGGLAANLRSDGVGTAASFRSPAGLALDGRGHLLVADYGNHLVRIIDLRTQFVDTLAGAGVNKPSIDGASLNATFSSPMGIAVSSTGEVFVSDRYRLRKVYNGAVTTVAGTTARGYVDGVGSVARFQYPQGVVVAANGDVFVADTWCVRRIQPSGMVTTVAGSRSQGGVSDGVGTAALFNNAFGLALGPKGFLFVSDYGASSIRTIDISAGAQYFFQVTIFLDSNLWSYWKMRMM